MSKQTLTQQLAEEYGDELRRLYVNKQLTSIEIANLFSVSKPTILRTLNILKVPKRHGRGMSYAHPERKPTKEQLDKWLNKDLETLQGIANKLECDPSSVRNWAIEYGIDWDKTPWRQAMNREEPVRPTRERLEDLYLNQGLSLYQIADLLGCSRTTITHRMKKHDIPLRKSGWKATWFKCKDGHRVRSTYEQRVDDWLFEHGLLHVYEPSVPFDSYIAADFLIGETYIEIWGVYDNARYAEQKARKRQLYKQYDLKLIEINWGDFATKTNQRWQRKLSVLLLKD